MVSLAEIITELGADSAAIMAPNDSGQHMYCYDSVNMPPEWVAIKNPYDEYTNKGNVYVFKSGSPVINNGFSDVFHGHYIESVLIVPIMDGEKVAGTLELIHSEKGKSFSESDLQKAKEFSGQIVIANKS
jgi:transcriptional regulator with GAF, ATPase, and Fis domain